MNCCSRRYAKVATAVRARALTVTAVARYHKAVDAAQDHPAPGLVVVKIEDVDRVLFSSP